jgi:hypothetical protein
MHNNNLQSSAGYFAKIEGMDLGFNNAALLVIVM